MKVFKYFLIVLFLLLVHFSLPRLMPGDPFLLFDESGMSSTTMYTEEQIESYRRFYQVDGTVFEQLFTFVTNLSTGQLGRSMTWDVPVQQLLIDHLPWTFYIFTSALFFSFIAGTLLGAWSTTSPRIDTFFYSFFIILRELPAFLIGLFLLITCSIYLNVLPLSGGKTPFLETTVGDILWHSVGPITTLCLIQMPHFYFLARSSFLESKYAAFLDWHTLQTVPQTALLFVQRLRYSLPTLLVQLCLNASALFGATLIVEVIFDYPGIGRLLQEAILTRDYIVLQNILFFSALFIVGMNSLGDLLQHLLDPRLRRR